ncbi:SPW repeat protein [Coprothermobacteraceae bacterium]|nr:SPW repeat protein [Coprothermobacteraceae bacterium]
MPWIVSLVGVWYLVSPWIVKTAIGAMWNSIVVGILSATCAYYYSPEKSWQRWLGILLGIWVVIAAFIDPLKTGPGYMWNNVLVGMLIVVAGLAAISPKHR